MSIISLITGNETPVGQEWVDDRMEEGQQLATSAVEQVKAWSVDDPDTWTDDALRWAGGAVKTASNWWQESTAEQEGIRDDMLRGVGNFVGLGFKVLDAGSYYGGQIGGKVAEFIGVDSRIGGAIGNVTGDVLAGGAFAKGLKAAKYVQKGEALEDLTQLAFKLAPEDSVAKLVYETGGGFAPVPGHLGKGARRNFKGTVVDGQGALTGSTYKTVSQYNVSLDPKRIDNLTEVHHVGVLDDMGAIALAHKTGDDVVNGVRSRSIIAELAEERYGIKAGNHPDNLVDILATDTGRARRAKIDAIIEDTGGKIHSTTVNDLLGTTKSKIKHPETGEIIGSRGINLPDFEKGDYDLMSDWHNRFPNEPFPLKPNYGKDPFPDIRIMKPGTKELIEVWTPKNMDEYSRRFQIVYEKMGVKKKFKSRDILIDSDLEIFGGDHTDVHDLIRSFQKTPGNPLFEATELIKSGAMRDLPLDQAVDIYAATYKMQQNITAHVLKRRYNMIEELWKQSPDSLLNKKAGRIPFNQVSAERKVEFVKNNIAQIASINTLKPGLSMADTIAPITGYNRNMLEVWGWKPQDIKNYVRKQRKRKQ